MSFWNSQYNQYVINAYCCGTILTCISIIPYNVVIEGIDLKNLNRRPKPGIKPTAVARLWDDLKDKYIWINLYGDEDTEEGALQDRYITKFFFETKLFASVKVGLNALVNQIDIYVTNPYSIKAAPMQWFSSARVESFLAENAEEYAV
jgi:hypothetical protein